MYVCSEESEVIDPGDMDAVEVNVPQGVEVDASEPVPSPEERLRILEQFKGASDKIMEKADKEYDNGRETLPGF